MLKIFFFVFMSIAIIGMVETGALFLEKDSITKLIFNKIKTLKFKIIKYKIDSLSILKEIKNQLNKYDENFSNWNQKVSRFQVEVYYEIENIIRLLENSNDETRMEFDVSYRETIWTFYKLLKENEFVVTKREHGSIYPMLKEIREDAMDIQFISNSVEVNNTNEALMIENEYIKRTRENRQTMKGGK